MQFLSFATLILCCQSVSAKYDPTLPWHTLETKYFLFHYHDGLNTEAHKISQKANDIHQEVSTFFSWQPAEKTHVILTDQTDLANGSAGPLPNNTIILHMTPPSNVGSLQDYLDWKYLVFKHEYVHIVHLDMAKDFPLHMRNLLGRHWILFPHTFLPLWMKEGIATHIETDLVKNTGRGQNSYFRGLMRNEVKNGIRSLNQINQPQIDWPGGTSRYLYGVYFFKFIEDNYGVFSIQTFMKNYAQFPVPFFINTNFKSTFGKSLYELWDEFEIYLEHEFKDEKAKEINENETKQVSKSGYNSGFSRQLNSTTILYIEDDQENFRSLIAYDSQLNRADRIYQSPKLGTSFDVHPFQGILIPQFDLINSSNYYSDLYRFDLITQKISRLTTNQRYIRAVWHTDGDKIIAVKNETGQHRIDLLDNKGELIKILWQEKDVVIGAMDFSPIEEKFIASIFRPTRGWSLEEFNLKQEQWTTVTNNSFIESQPRYSNDGSSVFFTAEYSKYYQIYELALSSQSLFQLTNQGSANLFPTVDENTNQLFFAALGKNGYDLVRKPIHKTLVTHSKYLSDNKSELATVKIESPIDESDQLVYDYNGLKYLSPPWWEPLPLLSGNNQQLNLGFVTSSQDPINRHLYLASLIYDVRNNTPMWNIRYSYTRLFPEFELQTNQNYFFPNDFVNRRERGIRFTASLPIRKIKDNWTITSTLKHITNRYKSDLGDVSNANFNTNLMAFGIQRSTSVQTSRAVFLQSGYKVSLAYEQNKFSTLSKQNGRIVANAKIYSPVWFHSVFTVGATVISAGGQAGPIFVGGNQSEFFSGGSLGKRSYKLKGYQDDTLIGSNMQKITFDTFIPLYNPQYSLMIPPIGISRIKLNPFLRAARVGSYHTINQASWFKSVGSEINFHTNFGYARFPFTINIGLVSGLDEPGENQIYFNIVSNFL